MMDDPSKRTTLPGIATPPPPVEEPPMPSQIGPYPVEGELSHGGMSRLYLGTHPETHQAIAIKVLLPQFVNHPEMKERFMREAEIISLANHPNIVKLYGYGDWEGGLYIAMEFIQGISLRQFILQHSMSLRRAIDTVLQISAALLHLHAHGVVHRDLKPENILFTTHGGIKVIDFGIAQLHTEEETGIQPGQVIGTPVYMAPEQRDDPTSASFPADIYSLAILAYELILGRLSHGVVHINQLPRRLQKILSKALQADPSERYQDITELITDLKGYIESGQLEKDEKGRGYAQDLAEHLRKAQETLLPTTLPPWPKVSIGLASHRDLTIAGIYYDFLELEEGAWAILLAEPSSKGVEGIVHAAMLQGMIYSVTEQTSNPTEIVNQVNQLIAQHTFEEIFTLNLLILNPRIGELSYISCGYGPLWLVRAGTGRAEMLVSDNIAIGIDARQEFLCVNQRWGIGDTLVLSTLRAGGEDFQHALEESLYTSPQNQAEALLRRTQSGEKTALERRPATIISIERTA